MKKLSSLLFCALALQLGARASAETLQIGVSHSEYLPPVHKLEAKIALPAHYQSASLKAQTATTDNTSKVTLDAATMQADQLPPVVPPAMLTATPVSPAPPPAASKPQPTLNRPLVEWFPIPTPMAGMWTKRGDTTTSVTDLRTGISQALNQWIDDEMTVTWGHQTDKQGNVWHANLLPTERDSMSSGKAVKFLTVGQKLEGTAPDALVTRTHYVVSELYRPGGPVADIFQQEALNHYQLIADANSTILQNNSTNRVFAYAGQPLRDGALLSRFTRVGAFSPTSNLSGIDLVQSLNDYLHSIGRPDLAR
ncbi:MAG: hypothetical protein KGS72_21970 [Cyanobacteria bacterium REEB67]|nr:hypothetical protein [Cyanobacteria bacterium REEB67]